MYKCVDCNVETTVYVNRCYPCKVKWYDEMEKHVHKPEYEHYERYE